MRLENEESRPRSAGRGWAAVPVLLALAGAAVVVLTAALGSGEQTRSLLWRHPAGVVLAAVGACYGAFALAVNLVRLVLVLRYRPAPAPPDNRLPTVTVLVPAYNEGPRVGQTLASLAGSDYPPDRVQIIAIDDGSEDDTWQHIRRAAEESAGRIQAVRCPANRGKRHALHEGIRRAGGEIIVTVDSDSVVEPGALRRLVAPLVADGRVGAVAGNVRVLNREQGFIPRLLAVSFVAAFDFVRAAESELGAVLCTPGALSAYRASCLRAVLDRWIGQRYFGRPANIGEDRALTNLVLEQGWQVKFQSTARVLTTAPRDYTGLRRMFTRWARSDVRESLAFARFGFGRFGDRSAWQAALARMNFLAKAASLLVAGPLLAVMLVLAAMSPAFVGLKLLSGAVLGSLWTVGICWFRAGWTGGRRVDAFYGIAYGLFWVAALWWIAPWGLVSSHRNGWLTRKTGASRDQARSHQAYPWPRPGLA